MPLTTPEPAGEGRPLATLAAGLDLAEAVSATPGWTVIAVRGCARAGYRVVAHSPDRQRTEVESLARWLELCDR